MTAWPHVFDCRYSAVYVFIGNERKVRKKVLVFQECLESVNVSKTVTYEVVPNFFLVTLAWIHEGFTRYLIL